MERPGATAGFPGRDSILSHGSVLMHAFFSSLPACTGHACRARHARPSIEVLEARLPPGDTVWGVLTGRALLESPLAPAEWASVPTAANLFVGTGEHADRGLPGEFRGHPAAPIPEDRCAAAEPGPGPTALRADDASSPAAVRRAPVSD